ncbi:MAG: hypothetical protein FD187_652 [bacterium]|nr:MAG: hypothetical protein FD142_909 [bacterium]KAF0150062.1 MAG: hypothetical protein FD187_652 [bacterium]KAF0169170.1 MAG: hypothetical protein FD158_722 [bacterium]TXT17178.1 MAG: hypothetical protein FD132_2536 [bacterium]
MRPINHPELVLRRYHVLLYVVTFLCMSFFWPHVDAPTLAVKLYVLATTLGYAALYVLPVFLLNSGLRRLLVRNATPASWRMAVVYTMAVLTGSAVLLAIYADYRLFIMYDYHINGFVWNLITTPGGIAALGATRSTEMTATFQAGLFVIGCVASLFFAHRIAGKRWLPSRRNVAIGLASALSVLASTEFVYAYSAYTGKEDVLAAADAIPFHLHSHFTKLFGRLGVERTSLTELRLAGGVVDYPGTHLLAKVAAKPANVIMLVAESFRWDLLTPEITPNLWRLSQRGLRFDKHYSGGNRTRMGMFSMFYGIYAPYWYSFEKQRIAPALMNYFSEHDYQMALHTSQSFTYPELDHTVFANVDPKFMQALQTGEPWQRDIRNIDDLMGKLDQRKPDKPFYGFMFFESTHAPYSFPEDKALRPDYITDFNYIKLNLAQNIAGIHARYINGAHHIDAQVGRLLAHLEENKLMDNTVILFTGDHGEEFMEKGRWGHGHGNTFPEEQIRVPLVLWMPGKAAQVVGHRTSHLQIAPTLLEYLGVMAPSRSYSSAEPLLTPMDSFVVGEYDHMSIIDATKKITFPYTGADFFRYRVYDNNDHPMPRERAQTIVSESQPLIQSVVLESMRFVAKTRH